MSYIGIDLGTSAMKLLLVGEGGEVLNVVSEGYDVEYPHPGWSQQDPEDWWRALLAGVPRLLEGHDASAVRGIGAGGQMHGLVALDAEGRVIRPCILWNDGRTEAQTRWLNEHVGRARLTRLTGNVAFAGFTAPKLLWMREEEPELFARIARVMLPKDYLTHRLAGVFVTDYSDASGTLLLDVEHRCWSGEMLELCGIVASQLPRLAESAEAVGTLLPDVARELGLPDDVVVCAGAGDNAAAAVGCGAVRPGTCNVSLGTSGTVFMPSARFRVDEANALHSFDYVDGTFHLMGCILSAASCNAWWLERVLGTDDYAGELGRVDEDRVTPDLPYFLPYLMGERSPHNDPSARGAFVGLRMDGTRADMTRAVLEGVSFAIRDCVEVARSEGVEVRESTLCGGGARSELWQRMLASVLGVTLRLPQTEQGPGFGAALLAAVACGRYPSVAAAAEAVVRMRREVGPDPALVEAYDRRYQVWRELYPALRPTFGAMRG